MTEENHYTILYAEDDAPTREIFCDSFLSRSFGDSYVSKVLAASNGREALELWREHRPDVVVTDLWMPDMGGIELIQKIRAEGGEDEVIITSAFQNKEYFISAIDLRILCFLQKPIVLKKFETALRRAFDSIAARRTLASQREKLTRLSLELTLAEERERRRLSEWLHDGIIQNLALLSMWADLPENGGVSDRFKELISNTVTEARNLMYYMSPPVLYEFGLAEALEWLSEEFAKHGLNLELGLTLPRERISQELEVFLFRATRELLQNVLKHAAVERAWVTLGMEDDFMRLSILDRGKGFNTASREFASRVSGFGLFSIRERAQALGGGMKILSEPGKGTEVMLWVPPGFDRGNP